MPKITLDAASGGAHGRLTRPEAASYLGVAASTMADGRRFSRVEALIAFIASGSRARHETTVER
jgi:hypothetical protein